MTQAYITDTETTGLVEPIEILSLATASLELTADNYHVGQAQEEFFCPSKEIEWGAMATHGIVSEDLVGKRPSEVAVLPADCTHIVGHNIDYDWKALGKPGVKRICTLAMARAAWPKLDSHSLGACLYYLLGPKASTREALKGAHGAATDVGLAALLLPTLLEELGAPTSIEALWRVSEDARIPKTMAFGKHRGKPIAQVDAGWVAWYRRQEDTDEYLLKAFRQAGK
jgi:exodeoxyribonuclease X